MSTRFESFLHDVADPANGWEYGDGTPMYKDARAFLAMLKRLRADAAIWAIRLDKLREE